MKWRIKELNYNDGTTGYQIQNSWLGWFWDDYIPWPKPYRKSEDRIEGYHENLDSALRDLNRLKKISDKKVVNSSYITRG
ncbi:hypothetical protein VP424E501_P0266 [Vibrio phage 424E50-1]|nr:hypothetical protein VP424E501_P0266 [Vibrio phage 424E50-1]